LQIFVDPPTIGAVEDPESDLRHGYDWGAERRNAPRPGLGQLYLQQLRL
jgi:hypothetical protein